MIITAEHLHLYSPPREGSHTSMQLHHHLDASSTRPSDGLIEVVKLALHEGFAIQRGNGPVSHRDSNMIQPGLGNLIEVVLSDPGVPMLGQSTIGLVLAQGL